MDILDSTIDAFVSKFVFFQAINHAAFLARRGSALEWGLWLMVVVVVLMVLKNLVNSMRNRLEAASRSFLAVAFRVLDPLSSYFMNLLILLATPILIAGISFRMTLFNMCLLVVVLIVFATGRVILHRYAKVIDSDVLRLYVRLSKGVSTKGASAPLDPQLASHAGSFGALGNGGGARRFNSGNPKLTWSNV